MLKKLLLQILLLLAFETLVVLGLVSAVRWLTIQHASPLVRGLVFLLAMALFVPPLMVVAIHPYRVPPWLEVVQVQGACAPAEVLKNEHIGDYWRPQDMPRFVTLRVLVQPDGNRPFQARLTCRLQQAQPLAVGVRLAVRYDPQRPDQVALDD